eukprot:g3430.t1
MPQPLDDDKGQSPTRSKLAERSAKLEQSSEKKRQTKRALWQKLHGKEQALRKGLLLNSTATGEKTANSRDNAIMVSSSVVKAKPKDVEEKGIMPTSTQEKSSSSTNFEKKKNAKNIFTPPPVAPVSKRSLSSHKGTSSSSTTTKVSSRHQHIVSPLGKLSPREETFLRVLKEHVRAIAIQPEKNSSKRSSGIFKIESNETTSSTTTNIDSTPSNSVADTATATASTWVCSADELEELEANLLTKLLAAKCNHKDALRAVRILRKTWKARKVNLDNLDDSEGDKSSSSSHFNTDSRNEELEAKEIQELRNQISTLHNSMKAMDLRIAEHEEERKRILENL